MDANVRSCEEEEEGYIMSTHEPFSGVLSTTLDPVHRGGKTGSEAAEAVYRDAMPLCCDHR